MKTGGKRKSVQATSKNSDDLELDMSFRRKRMKVENNNTYKNDGDATLNMTHLTEMGVSLLPLSDIEEEEEGEGRNYSNQGSPPSDNSSLDSLVLSMPHSVQNSGDVLTTPPDDDFKLVKRSARKTKNSNKRDPFSLLSDEIVLMIFHWLPRQHLSECALVCHRWRQITYDESLWQRMDITGSVLKPDYMGYILQRNPFILRMSQVEVISPMFEEMAPVLDEFTCQVQYLDLSMAIISAQDLAVLLGKCRSLKKLSLEHCTADTAVCSSIAANTELEVLNMSQCYQVGAAGLEEILINCSELLELNLAWTRLDSECVDIVCKLVNENIRQLNMSGGLKWMKDGHVKELVSRCTCLTDLDLSDCTQLSETCLKSITEHLCDIELLSFSRCYNIPPSKYTNLNHIESLEYLNIYGLMHPKQLEVFKEGFKKVKINEHPFSTIARPTVGIRRTSIWGHRVRD